VTLSEQIDLLLGLLENSDGNSAAGYELVSTDAEEKKRPISLLDWASTKHVDSATGEVLGATKSHLPTHPDTPKGSHAATVGIGKGDPNNTHPIQPAPDFVRHLASQIHGLDTSARCPILAITGLLNAGKSSLLASFLSHRSQRRVLIGSENDAGTHRFILWFPANWKSDTAVRQILDQQIHTIFGCSAEPLSEDLDVSRRQYNGQLIDTDVQTSDPMNVPLIAWDTNLDEANVALMDCPDIQTGLSVDSSILDHSLNAAEQATAAADRRAGILARVIRMCSAFLVVVNANSLRDNLVAQLLSTLQVGMPGLRRFLLINRVPRRYETQQIADEGNTAYQSAQLDRIYMAYHFDGPENRQRLPDPPSKMSISPHQQLPVFFQIHPSPTPQPPAEIPESHYVQNLGSQLDPNQLSRDAMQSLVAQLSQSLTQLARRLTDDLQRRADMHRRAYQALAMAAVSTSLADPKLLGSLGRSSVPIKLRLHASREIIEQIATSLERTAPWWAYASVKVNQVSGSIRKWFQDAANRIPSFKWFGETLSGSVESVRSQFRSGESGRVMSANDYCDQILNRDSGRDLLSGSQQPESGVRDDMLGRCHRAIDRFQRDSQTRLNEDQLDAFTAIVWSQMSWGQRIWQQVMPATLVFAPLIAVMTLPFDFGGTAVLFSASVSEMLLAGAAGAGAVLLRSDNMPKIAEEKAAFQQVSDLFAITCDEFGLPRPADTELPSVPLGNSTARLERCELPIVAREIDAIIPPRLEIDPMFIGKLEQRLAALAREAKC
jgi:hypothetical protein